MQGNRLHQAYHIPGTLAANIAIQFTVEANMTLLHVSAVASNDSDATLEIGTSADQNGFLVAVVIGDSNVPVEFELADFDGALLGDPGNEYPRLVDGDIFTLDLDYDGSAGTAAANVTIVLTFSEG